MELYSCLLLGIWLLPRYRLNRPYHWPRSLTRCEISIPLPKYERLVPILYHLVTPNYGKSLYFWPRIKSKLKGETKEDEGNGGGDDGGGDDGGEGNGGEDEDDELNGL